MFFLVLADIEDILQEIESSANIQYYETGLFNSKNTPVYDSIFHTSNIGIAVSGDWNRIDSYLILQKNSLVNIREIPQRTGDTKFAVDQMNNPNSIELKLGGVFNDKENVIVAGRVSTISETNVSNELYKLFSKKIKKSFRKIGAFYVGKLAEEKLKNGWRLVTSENSPKDYDLKFS